MLFGHRNDACVYSFKQVILKDVGAVVFVSVSPLVTKDVKHPIILLDYPVV